MRHPYHLVEPSPWPILVSLNLLFSLLGLVSFLNGYLYSLYTSQFSLILVVIITLLWMYDIITESLYMGTHSISVSKGLLLGFILFVVTEAMLFFSLFWAYFHSALHPADVIWPPVGIDLINPWSVPLLNTLLLLFSGVAATWSHHAFIARQRSTSINSLIIGIILGIIFVALQGFEYYNSSYDITDSVYSSAFYVLTGFHGIHIMVGLSFLAAVLYRLIFYHTPNVFFDIAMLYWHFVDIIWLFLFVLIYYMSY